MQRTASPVAVGLIAALLVAATTTTTPGAEPISRSTVAGLKSGRLRALANRFLGTGNEAGFWEAVGALADSGEYPIVEEIAEESNAPAGYVRLTFLHRQQGEPPENVLLFANINHVVPAELLFQRIEGTGVWFETVEVPRGVRFTYRIIENDPLTGLFAAARFGTRLHLLGRDPDPLNPDKKVYPDGLGDGRDYIETRVELPGAAPQPYIADRGHPRGTLIRETRASRLLGYSHELITFLPPGHDPDRAYPLLILLDGLSYFSEPLQLTLENLIAERAIPPLVVLGVDAGVKDGRTQRNEEFTCSPRFREFIHDELLPWFTSKVRVAEDPGLRAIGGSSFGGLFAAYFAFHHPGTVSNVLSQSGSFHWGSGSFLGGRKEGEPPFEVLIHEFAFGEKKPISIWMEVGTLEGEYSWTAPDFPNQLVSHRHFKLVLDMKGYDATYREYGGGHEMLSWRGGIADGLVHIFGRQDLATPGSRP